MKYKRLLLIVSLLFSFITFPDYVSAQKDDKYLLRARKLSDRKKYDEALELYRKSLQTNPNWKAAYGIGSEYLRRENPTEAIVYFRKAQELKSDEPMIWYSIGYSYGKLNDNEQAVTALQKAVELKPDYGDAWYNLGSVQFKLERYKDAVEAYKMATRYNPNDAEAYAFLGIAYGNLNNFEKAVESFQKAVKIAPSNKDYRLNLASFETRLKVQTQNAP